MPMWEVFWQRERPEVPRKTMCKFNLLECGKVFKDGIFPLKHIKIPIPDCTRTCNTRNKVFASKQSLWCTMQRKKLILAILVTKLFQQMVALLDTIKILTRRKNMV